MKWFTLSKRPKWGDVLIGVFLVLLIIPQTGQPIRIGINRLKTMVWSPSISNSNERPKISPFEYSLLNLDQKTTIQSIGKGEITFLGFWATWCAPCVAELPSIETLYEDYGDDVNFVLVTREQPETVADFLAKKGLGLPVYFPVSEVPEALQSPSIPTNFLIDQKGHLLIEDTGAANWNSAKVR